MDIKVVTIGPEDVNGQVLTVAKEYPEITLLSAPYNHELETVDVVKNTEHNADIYLFAGTIPYQIAKQYQITDKPMVFIPLSGTALYRTLFKIVTETSFNPIKSPFRFSIDTFNKDEVEECLDELEFHPEELYLSNDQTADELVAFHYRLWSDKKIDIAITCVKSVYEALIDLGVLAYRVIPTKSTIRTSLQKVKLEGKALLNSTTQIAVGLLHFNDAFTSSHLADYKTKRKKAALQNQLIDFGEDARAIFDWSDRDEVRFITTRGAIENITQKYKKITLLNDIAMKTDIESSLGVGFGHTANEAEINAREALKKAQLNKLHCFVVDVEGTVYGPIGKDTQLQYSLRSDDPFRLTIAKSSGLSIATINRLLSFCENFGSENITAIALANGLDMSVRSARRILNILERSNLAVIAGEEQPIHRGRPRHLYNILLFEEIKKSKGVLK